MANYDEQLTITLTGDWNNGGPSIGGESLVVRHSENGISPGVTFMNDGGGHFVQRFVFGGNSGLPQGEAATFWANWNGLVIAANRILSLVIGDAFGGVSQMEITDGVVSVKGNVGIGTNAPASKLHIVGNPDQWGTIRFEPDVNKGPWHSHVHWDPTGDWYIRSAAANGKVVIQDQDPSGFVGIGTAAPTAKLEVNGDLKVTGDVILTSGADCAEEFDVIDAENIEAGSVMVINDLGNLQEGNLPYDKRVAGVVSGAGDFKPAITLDKQSSQLNRKSVALLGKVYCKVDAGYASIEVGDLLTTSPTTGHAMKALDQVKAFGAVIGKALKPLRDGRGLIPILIALQ